MSIDHLGFYIHDSYDFNGNQPLGGWSAGKVRKLPSARFALVQNESFRNWRKQHNQGGDFIIFSYVRWESGTAAVDLELHCVITGK